jgi:hypothetical protein
VYTFSSHKEPRAQALIEAAGAELRFLPSYSPDFSHIENAFAKLKAPLRKAAERTVEGLWSAIGRIVDIFSPAECASYFGACSYDQDYGIQTHGRARFTLALRHPRIVGFLSTCFRAWSIGLER